MTHRRTLSRILVVVLVATLSVTSLPTGSVSAAGPIELSEIGRYYGSGAEIAAFDASSNRMYVTGGGSVQVVDLSDPTQPERVGDLPYDATSVAVKNGIVAIAVPSADEAKPKGSVVLIDPAAPDRPKVIRVGVLPDMITFTPDGTKVLTADEAEPGDLYDAEGTVSVIDLTNGVARAKPITLYFRQFNPLRDELRSAGLRLFPGKRLSQDLEPEYVAVSPDSQSAYVTLQENNALAVVDLSVPVVTAILPLGTKDHSLAGNALDPSDRDGGINIANWPVHGLFMPDAIAAFSVAGLTYLATANEGDSRGENERIQDVALDPAAFPDAAFLQERENLGRLSISTNDGDLDGDGDFDALYSYGARSFTIWDAAGNRVFDSGDQLEQLTAALTPDLFNANDGSTSAFDTRSDDKGPEPEAVTVGEVDGTPYLFVGLERAGGGVLVYDLANPAAPAFVQYVRSDADIAPEGLVFVPAAESPTGLPLLLVANEVSFTVAIYEIRMGS